MENTGERTETYRADISGERADAAGARLSGSTRARVARMIENGDYLINGHVPKKSDKVNSGDVIELRFRPEKVPDLAPRNIPFGIALEKPGYAIIEKPAGLTVHPAPGHYDDTLVNAILYAFDVRDDENGIRPGIVHRLDKDTSGLMTIAKNSEYRTRLSKLFSDRKVDKRYVAICRGVPSFVEKTVDEPIGRDGRNRKKMTVRPDGRKAVSVFTVKETYRGAFLAEVRIFTGRTHQIRVHAAHIGHPLVGDVLYGGSGGPEFARQALHSARLEFPDPDTGEPVSARSELPEDMAGLIKILRDCPK